MSLLPIVQGITGRSTASGISADGRVIAGDVTIAGARLGFVYDAVNGMRLLQDVYREQTGIDPGPIAGVRAISPDGRTFAGTGFILRLRAPCAGDVDDGSMSGGRDGSVTPDDLTAFLEWMSVGDRRADLDDGSGNGRPDAAISIDDLLYFLRGYVDGC